MADDQHRDLGCLPIIQMLGQPVDCLHIEMVGRLIQNQQIMIGKQQFHECDPATLATAQAVRLRHQDRHRPADVRRSLAYQDWRPTRGLARRRR